MRTAPAFPNQIVSVLEFIAFLESLYPAGCIQHATFTCEKRVTIAAYLNLKLFLGRTGFKRITAGADYLGIGVIFRMYFFFHYKLSRVNADLSPVSTGWFILYDTIDKSV